MNPCFNCALLLGSQVYWNRPILDIERIFIAFIIDRIRLFVHFNLK